jgi:probable F420-dependent oxidoreductase
MKIRIGVGSGGACSTPEALGELVAGLDEFGFDSLWLSEVLTGPVLDPVVGLAWAASNNPRVKLGTTMLLPGRNALRLAKQLASLDVLSRGRLLVTLVPGLTYAPEREAIGVDPKHRGALIDEVLPLLRRLWAGETVSHDGAAGRFRDVTLWPLPVQQPLEVWLGGTAPAALERCGRLSDGWLPSLCTPDEAAAGRAVIEEAAARAGRRISSEHFGISIGYAGAPIDPWGCRRCERSSSSSSPSASPSSSCVRWPRRRRGAPSSRAWPRRSEISRPDRRALGARGTERLGAPRAGTGA